MTESRSVSLRSGGVSLVCIIIAIVLFLVAALGVGSKLGINIEDLGLVFLAASFIF